MSICLLALVPLVFVVVIVVVVVVLLLLLLLCSSMALSQIVSTMVWMKVVVFGRFSMLPRSCSYSVAP